MIDSLPTVNAVLNSTSAVLLVIGHGFMKRGRIDAHRRCMVSAFSVSTLFLVSYLTYHAYHGTTRFAGEGWIRPVYFTILLTHTILATATVPLALITLRRGLKDAIDRHKAIARWAYPVWLYVSVTGVVVYVMLYHLHPAG